MQYWFLIMGTENSWASKCLEAELRHERLQECVLSTCSHPGNILACRHTAYYCKLLSTHRVPWSSFGNKAPQKGDCAACLHEQRLLVFGNCLPGTLRPVETGGEFISFSRKKIKPIVTHFQHRYMSMPSGKACLGTLWTFLSAALICARSAVGPSLLLTKELRESTWRPWASCKTQGGEGLLFSDSSSS